MHRDVLRWDEWGGGMSEAVGVLIVDEPQELDPNVRAALEHAPALRTIDEADLNNSPAVALVSVGGARAGAERHRIASLRAGRPSLRILVAFRTLAAADMIRLAEAGADAFVGQAAPAREICAAILALAQGSPLAALPEMPAPAQSEAADGLGLTPREAEVLRFLSAGYSNKEVARRLSLSVRTVETHRLNLRRKTQTGRLKDLVSLARHLGLDPVLDAETPRRPAPRPEERLARH